MSQPKEIVLYNFFPARILATASGEKSVALKEECRGTKYCARVIWLTHDQIDALAEWSRKVREEGNA